MKGNEGFENAAALLPGDIRAAAISLSERVKLAAEEFRLRAGAEPCVLTVEGERPFSSRKITVRDLERVLEAATMASAHTALGSVASGYVTVRGGCRVGLCGEVSRGGGEVLTIRRLSGAAIRIPREVKGCADGIFKSLTAGPWRDTLIISPPGMGKTTLLRELVRRLSEVYRVGLLDERGEVAGVWEGVPEFDVGNRTDVLTGADKRSGAVMLLRSMNPQLLAMDEITASEDMDAVRAAAGCGVGLLASAHASSLEEMRRRSLYRELFALGVFQRAVRIEVREHRRVYTLEEVEA